LLEYHSKNGTASDGRVMTANSPQSNCQTKTGHNCGFFSFMFSIRDWLVMPRLLVSTGVCRMSILRTEGGW
jgi:hypothetical protein